MRYFVRRLNNKTSILFRVLPEVAVEVYDVTAHAWHPRDLEPLYRWAVVEPEMGVDEIPADEAAALIHELEFGKDAGRRRGPDRLRHSR